MALKCIRKLVLVTLLLLSSAFYCYSQESSSEQHVTTGLMERDRVELELARTRSEQYENIYRSARITNRELGECLSRSTTTLSGLREQIQEIRRRYEEMENLLNSAGDYDSNIGDNNSGNTSNITE